MSSVSSGPEARVRRLDMIFTINTPSNSMRCHLIQRVNNFWEHYISAQIAEKFSAHKNFEFFMPIQ